MQAIVCFNDEICLSSYDENEREKQDNRWSFELNHFWDICQDLEIEVNSDSNFHNWNGGKYYRTTTYGFPCNFGEHIKCFLIGTENEISAAIERIDNIWNQ